jgi:hypothetical protein
MFNIFKKVKKAGKAGEGRSRWVKTGEGRGRWFKVGEGRSR